MKIRKESIYQIALFGVVGLTTVFIDVIVTTASYRFLGLSPFLASSIGFCSGFFFNFPMNRHRVFKYTNEDRFGLGRQVTMVLGLSMLNLFLSGLFVQTLVINELVNISIAKMIATAIIAVWNFLLFKHLIFSKRSTEDT